MNKKYIRQVGKRLKCSRNRRKEIEKQLTSEIMAEMENGESVQEVMKRIGTPAEIAEEFNSSFTQEEKKKYRKQKRIKRLLIIALVILGLAAVVYWILPKTTEIENSRVFQKEEVQQQAKKIVQFLNEEDYDALQACSTEKLKDLLNREAMAKAREYFGTEWGDFQSYGNIYMAQINQMGKCSAVVQMNASYEHVNITYTLCFDKNMKLEGLWMK